MVVSGCSSAADQPQRVEEWFRLAKMGCGRCALPAGTRAGHATVILLFVMSACVLRMQPILGTTSITSLTNWLASVALTATMVVLVPTKLAVRYARRPLCTLGLTALALVCCAATVDTYVGIVHGRMQGMGVAAAVASGLYVARLWPLAVARVDPSASTRLKTRPEPLNLCFYNYGGKVRPLSKMKLAHQCALESMVRLGMNVTMWTRGHDLVDDLDLGITIRRHAFSNESTLGRWWYVQRIPEQGILGGYDTADIMRMDVLERYGGVYVDNDVIVLSDNITRVGRGLARQNLVGAHMLNNAVLKFPAHDPFIKRCVDDLIRVWEAYADGKTWRPRPGTETPRWGPYAGSCTGMRWLCYAMGSYGFLSPALFTRVFLYNWDPGITVYPGKAFGYDFNCNVHGMLRPAHEVDTHGRLVLHMCGTSASTVPIQGSYLDRVYRERCPATVRRHSKLFAPN